MTEDAVCGCILVCVAAVILCGCVRPGNDESSIVAILVLGLSGFWVGVGVEDRDLDIQAGEYGRGAAEGTRSRALLDFSASKKETSGAGKMKGGKAERKK